MKAWAGSLFCRTCRCAIRSLAKFLQATLRWNPVQSNPTRKYDPAAKEFEFVTPSGAHYIHGDVSPEQVAQFESATSKGKAFNEIKKSSTYVGKVVSGKRVNVRPPKGLASAAPD